MVVVVGGGRTFQGSSSNIFKCLCIRETVKRVELSRLGLCRGCGLYNQKVFFFFFMSGLLHDECGVLL